MHTAAYAAGLFDGEGTVQITAFMTKEGRHNLQTVLAVCMTDREPVAWLATNFGGRVVCQNKLTKRGRAVYRWCVAGELATAFAKAMLPFSLNKRKQLLVFLEARAVIEAGVPRNAKGHIIMSEAAWAQRCAFMIAVRALRLPTAVAA